MSLRLKSYLLVTVMIASTAVSLLSSTTISAQTGEDYAGYASGALTQKVKNLTYTKVMKHCLDQIYNATAKGLVDAETINSGSTWLSYPFDGFGGDGDNNNHIPAAGYIVDPSDDGNLACAGDAGTIISGYKAALGSPSMSNLELVCSLGYQPLKEDSDGNLVPTGGDCVGEGSNPIVEYRLTSTPNVPGAGTAYKDEERYLAYRFAFLNKCGAKAIGFTENRTTTVTDGIYEVAITYEDGTSKYVDYTVDKPDQNLSVLFLEKKKCKDLAKRGDGGLMDQTHQAYNTWLTTQKPPGDSNADDDTTGAADGEGESVSNCQVEGIGWIVCPVARLMATIVDEAYGYVSRLLSVQPLLVNDNSGEASGIYKAWAVMRNFANVAFVVAFMIIILSQLTSIGISNYGLKRLMPRLVVSAILVNASFWICAAAVDISNITGASLRQFFDSIQADLSNDFAETITNSADTGEGWLGVTGFILALGGASIGLLYVGLSALLPALIAAITAIVTVFVVLALRQALIILLIVVSPLALVAYLLPNTESYFKKWRELLQVLLLMYPIIAIIFGASALASDIVMSSAPEDLELRLPIQIMGALISIIPLAITPIVMKTAGGLLNRWGGVINNPNKGPIDRLNKGAESYRKRAEGRREINALDENGKRVFGAGRFKRRAKRNAIEAGIESNVKRAQSAYVAEEAEEDGAFRNRTAGGTSLRKATGEAEQRALASAISVQAKLEADEVSAANAIIQNANLDLDRMQELAKGGTVTYFDADDKDKKNPRTLTSLPGSALQTAAIQSQFQTGDIAKTDELVKMSGSMGTTQRQAIGDGMLKLSGKAAYYGGASSDIVKQGGVNSEADLNKLVASTIEGGKFSGESLNGGDKDALTRISDVAANGVKDDDGNVIATVDPASIAKLRAAAHDGLTNPNLTQPVDRIRERVTAIEQGTAFDASHPPTPPPRPTPGAPATPATPASPTPTPSGGTPTASAPPPGWTTTPAGIVTPPPRRGTAATPPTTPPSGTPTPPTPPVTPPGGTTPPPATP